MSEIEMKVTMHHKLQDVIKAALRLMEERSDRNLLDDSYFLQAYLQEHGFVILDLSQSDNKCFAKAHSRGLPTFTLIATDPTAAATVKFWLLENPQLADDRRTEVEQKIRAMDNWPEQKPAD